LGGLAIAILMAPASMYFDACSKFYSGASFVAASVFVLLYYTDGLDFTGGLFFLVFFAIYIFAVGLAIYEGYLALQVQEEEEEAVAPVHIDPIISVPSLVTQEDDSPSPGTVGLVEHPAPPSPELKISVFPTGVEVRPSASTPLLGSKCPSSRLHTSLPLRLNFNSVRFTTADQEQILTPLTMLSPSEPPTFASHPTFSYYRRGADFRTVGYHAVRIFLGFLAVALSGFLLSYSSASLAIKFQISETVFGLTVLSSLSTLPEKFMSIIAGLEGNTSLLVASIAGSNVFLLTLCMGVLFIAGGEGHENAILAAHLLPFEVWITWICSVILLIIVWAGGRKWMGVILLVLYGAFNIAELTVYRR
jgi:Ca2+/Na+ antiporter